MIPLEAELTSLALLRDVLQQPPLSVQFPHFQSLPDDTLLLCLRARRLDTTRTVELLKRYIPWLEEKKIQNLTALDLKNELISSKIRLLPQARDKEGRIIIVAFPRFYFPSESPPINIVKLLKYLLDKALLQNPETQRVGFTVIVDGSNTTMANFDRKLPGAVLDAITNRYPGKKKITL
eukprot:TRINITY_DN2297_c0_g1_i1.p1 TRINITY_DN2297_c0_g1~~TRINITY_DN2297_c0_g1_i1.p1  ORF type:complete len:179 (-),score=26.48 TRINITY_DN2297_c0_g1_i1:31-567(-)